MSAQKLSYTRIGLGGFFGYVIPSSLVFFAFYFLNVITMLLIIGKKKTCLPGWMWIINPLTFKVLLNMIGKLGTSAFLNGLACFNMSLGALIIMTAWLIVIGKKKSGSGM